MVAVSLISVGVLGFFGTFKYIIRSLHVSRTRTLASNLAQEKIEILKNLNYYNLLITTTSAIIPDISPSTLYDTVNYPAETISISGITFKRYTYVTQATIHSDVVAAVSNTYPDTGMKQITVNIVWRDAGATKIWTLNNLLENPSVNVLNSGFQGTITIAGGGALSGALVQVEGNPSWYAVTASNGKYSFAVSSGAYTLRASSAGYYDAVSAQTTAGSGIYTTVNLSLSPIATGTISGYAWFNPGLVISQVVGTTNTATAFGQEDVEYVELFNPTTYQINMANSTGNGNSVTRYVRLNTQEGGSNYSDVTSCSGAQCVYVSSYVKAGGYYLIASYPTFVANGQWVTADSYYNNSASAPNDIPNHSCGSVEITNQSGSVIDQVCWNGDSCGGVTQYCNGTRIPTDSNCGMNTGIAYPACQSSPWEGNQLVRFSSPTVLGRGTLGSAYNAQNNATDFQYPVSGSASTLGLNYSPFTLSHSTLPIVAGVPAVAAEVAATDAYSGSTRPYAAYASASVGSQLYAPFSLVGVTTGTWSLDIATATATSTYFLQIDAIAITQNVTTSIPNASTTPSWPVGNTYSALLTSSSSSGFVKGLVTDANNSPISGIQVLAGGVTKTTGSNGTYFATVSTGLVTVTANPNNTNPSYTQQIVIPTVGTAQIVVQDFILSQGGAITGYITTGTTPLPNILVTANIGGSQYGAASSDSTGNFTILNLSTGTYTVQPVLDVGSAASPVSASVTVNSGSTVSAGTFTVTGAFGLISGSVTYNGSLITSGALIVASTSSLTTPPTAIYGSSSTTLTPIYAISSLADGTYSLPVRAGSGYNILVSIPSVNNGTVSIVSKTFTGVSVSASATTSQLLALP